MQGMKCREERRGEKRADDEKRNRLEEMGDMVRRPGRRGDERTNYVTNA